jgi:REP element-mobilizing transposase RayT
MSTIAPWKRKNIRLPAGYYTGRRSYFLTLCFDDRHRFGSNPRIARWLIARLRKHGEECRFFVHAYCVMPDQVHVLASAASDESSLMKFAESFKQDTGFEFAQRAHRRLWQFKYYDRILRSGDAADRVAWYIWLNPVRQGLCRAPAEYPFLGSFTEIGARMLKSSPAPEWTPPWKSKRGGKDAALKAAALH